MVILMVVFRRCLSKEQKPIGFHPIVLSKYRQFCKYDIKELTRLKTSNIYSSSTWRQTAPYWIKVIVVLI